MRVYNGINEYKADFFIPYNNRNRFCGATCIKLSHLFKICRRVLFFCSKKILAKSAVNLGNELF